MAETSFEYLLRLSFDSILHIFGPLNILMMRAFFEFSNFESESFDFSFPAYYP